MQFLEYAISITTSQMATGRPAPGDAFPLDPPTQSMVVCIYDAAVAFSRIKSAILRLSPLSMGM